MCKILCLSSPTEMEIRRYASYTSVFPSIYTYTHGLICCMLLPHVQSTLSFECDLGLLLWLVLSNQSWMTDDNYSLSCWTCTQIGLVANISCSMLISFFPFFLSWLFILSSGLVWSLTLEEQVWFAHMACYSKPICCFCTEVIFTFQVFSNLIEPHRTAAGSLGIRLAS
jgi:hypothetical protein